MHECNAMQLLETKEKKTQKTKEQKTMVTKEKTMKHKDHENQERSGTQNHTNYLTKSLKLTSIKTFDEDVGILTLVGIYSRHTIFLLIRSLMK